MLSARLERLGEPRQAIQIRDVPLPRPGEDEVLVRVVCASVNPLDWKLAQGQYRLVLRKPVPGGIGSDFSGQVVALGFDVGTLNAGDQVFGALPPRSSQGALSEYVLADARTLARKPPPVSHEAAASLPIAGLTALQSLRDFGKLRPGWDVLITGANGGVGSFALQIARILGAGRVTAVCRGDAAPVAWKLGADAILDYRQEDFAQLGRRYDLILDAAGMSSFKAARRALKPHGIYLSTLAGPRLILRHVLSAVSPGRRARAVHVRSNVPDLELLAGWVAEGRLKPLIDSRFPVTQSVEALERSRLGHPNGKIVVCAEAGATTGAWAPAPTPS